MIRTADVVGGLGVFALVLHMAGDTHELSAQSADESAVIAVVDAFHSALASGDSVTALAQVSPDVTILENGRVETLEQYRSGHLGADMRYARAVDRVRSEISVTVVGDVGWAYSTNVANGRMGDREIDAQGAELMVLVRSGEGWLIEAIHWSSRQRRPAG